MPRKWICIPHYHCTVIVAAVLPMAKTHLEHQLIKFKNKHGNNGTTSTPDPYANYDPMNGATTALILGMTFLIGIIYVSVKYGRQRCKTQCYQTCLGKLIRKNTQEQTTEVGDEEGREKMLPQLNLREKLLTDPKWRNQLAKAYQLSKELGMPIVVKGSPDLQDTAAAETPPFQQAGYTEAPNSRAESTNVPAWAEPAVLVDVYTMYVSENSSRPSVAKKSTRPETLHSRQSSQQQLLPPSANQVLRTAEWVNTLNNKPISDYSPDELTRKLSSPCKLELLTVLDDTKQLCTTKAEINQMQYFSEEKDTACGVLETSTNHEQEPSVCSKNLEDVTSQV